jgi:SH3-like domain-containing protein
MGLIHTLVLKRARNPEMRRYHTLAVTSLLVILVAAACSIRMNRTFGDINLLLDSLKLVYAPDIRIAYWKPEVTISREGITLQGEVGDKRAYDAIVQTVVGRYPEIAFNLVLLPEWESDRQVNGLINNSVAHLRSEPSHRSEMVTQALLGTPVRILKQEEEWFLVQTPNGYLGWLDGAALQFLDETGIEDLKISDKVIFMAQYGFVYEQPDDHSRPVSDLVAGCLLQVQSSEADYYRVVYPDGRVGWVKQNEVIDAGQVFGKSLNGDDLVKTALKYNGIPYLWGGTSTKAADCSGFSSMVYFMNGTILPRDADQQSRSGRMVTTTYGYESLLPGDLLFFGSRATGDQPERVTHVAIYVGDSEFIHASGRVRINSMDPERGNYLPEYPDIFIRAVRIQGEGASGSGPITENPFYKEIISTDP